MKKLRTLRPIRERPEFFDAIEEKIVLAFRREFYMPMLRALRTTRQVLKNSTDDLLDAITSGQIQYVDDHFEGQFDAAVSKELKKRGATWDRKNRWWSFPKSKLTIDMRSAISVSLSKFQEMSRKLSATLESMVPEEIADKMNLENLFDDAIYRVNQDFEESIKAVSIQAKLTPEQRRRIAEEYTNNAHLSIRDWTRAEIAKLREKVRDNAYKGVRYESLIKDIQKSYGSSQKKAKFIARQETSLMMTKFKQVRYQEAGIPKYRWQCVNMPKDKSPDQHTLGNVRFYHGIHDGKIFSWDSPPIVDAAGNRKNPGQDFNCRCVAVPVVEF